MVVFGSARLTRLVSLARFWLAITGTSSWSCSLLLKGDETQCNSDSDCARFPNTACNRGAGVCVARIITTISNATGGVPSGTSTNPTGSQDAGFPGRDASGTEPGVTGGSTERTTDGAADGPAIEVSTGDAADAGAADGVRTGDLAARECPDLDGNGILDCKESLVTNPDFKAGLVGWTPELNMAQGFSSTDGDGNPASGSIAVTNASQSDATFGSTIGGSEMCLPAGELTRYRLYVQTFFAPGASGLASAGAAFRFFATEDCSGLPNGAFMPPLAQSNPSGWRTLQSSVPTPGNTRSMAMRLVVLKPFSLPPAQAQFDNILLKPL